MDDMDSKYINVLDDLATAESNEWKRLVEENHELLAALRDIQRKHFLPLPMPTIPADTTEGAARWGEWMERCRQWPSEHPNETMCVYDSIITLAEKFGIPERLYVSLFFVVMMGDHGFARGFGWAKSNPTDLGDLYIRTGHPYFRRVAIELMLRNDPPPRPQPAKDNPRKLDWRPLHEWHLRHPGIKHSEIARALNYNAVTVRRKLAELDAEK